MSIATDGFGTIIAGLETGGGGGSVIPDGGTISGTYEGNLVCEGAVTLTGNLEVNGSMTVLGDFTNDGGYEVTIRGDLHAKAIYFDRADTSLPQSNFSVEGDLIFTYMEFRQSGGVAAQLRVGGDLIGAAGFAGTVLFGNGVNGSLGVAGTSGLNILVYGDLVVTDVQVYGGSNAAGAAGNGGSVTVWGDCLVGVNLDASGGDATDGDAGVGGFIDVYGDLSIPNGAVSVRGGEATNGNAGNAGTVDIEANFTGSEISAYGGNCTSDSENHRSGSGGYIYVYGQATWCNLMNVSGGDRFGTLSAGNTLTSPNAGEINVNGGISANDIFANGGDVYTDNFAPHGAGNGGNIYVDGNVTVSDDFEFHGGFANQGDAGNGGYMSIEGNVAIEDDFEFYGGDANNGNAGQGGNAYCYGSLTLDECRMSGGNGTNGNGGQGAFLFVKGDLISNEFYNGEGGDCNSNNETHYAGAGGSITVEGNFTYHGDGDDLFLSGGTRNGATTVANLGGPAASGGNLTVGGNFVSRVLVDMQGGSVFTDYPNTPGGSGGNLYVEGAMCVSDNVYLSGGRSVGNTGGSGGTIEVKGHAGFTSLLTYGGDSVESVVLGDAGQAGSAGTATFRAGLVTGEIGQVDGVAGTGGSAASAEVNLFLSGHCHIGTIEMTDRPICYIRRDIFFDAPVTLNVTSMPLKSTLNDVAGTATGSVSASLGSSLFMTGTGGTWYAIAGVLVP